MTNNAQLLSQTCNYPDCKCPTENPCLKGLPTDALGSLPVVAYMREWHSNGEIPTKERNEKGRMAWPGKFKFMPVTLNKCLHDDKPLTAHAQATAEIDKRDAEIADLKEELRITDLLQRAKLAGVDGLVDGLKDLLADTQHSTHNCGDKFCPVDRARAALATYEAAQGAQPLDTHTTKD